MVAPRFPTKIFTKWGLNEDPRNDTNKAEAETTEAGPTGAETYSSSPFEATGEGRVDERRAEVRGNFSC